MACVTARSNQAAGDLHGEMHLVKDYIFWGLFALVLIGIGLSQWDRRRRSRTAKELEEAYRAGLAAATRAKPAGGAHAPLHRDAAPLPPQETARLVCVSGSQKDHSFPVTVTGITIGRDPKNDVVISDPRVSYHHAWIGIIEHKVVLRDLGSTNGTFLNAQFDSPVSEVVLSPGDTIFFGGHGRDQFRFLVD